MGDRWPPGPPVPPPLWNRVKGGSPLHTPMYTKSTLSYSILSEGWHWQYCRIGYHPYVTPFYHSVSIHIGFKSIQKECFWFKILIRRRVYNLQYAWGRMFMKNCQENREISFKDMSQQTLNKPKFRFSYDINDFFYVRKYSLFKDSVTPWPSMDKNHCFIGMIIIF